MLKFRMKTIAVLGASGMLGSGVVDYFQTRALPVVEINRSGRPFYGSSTHIKFNASTSSVDALVSKLPGDVLVVNCVGAIKHKIDESNPDSVDAAIKVNSIFPVALAFACREKGIPVLQIATDCVFSGKSGSYSELSPKDPQDIYGLTKSAGEIDLNNVMTLRCSLLGKERTSQFEFLDWVLSHKVGSEISGYTNHFWNGVTVLDIARFIENAASQNFFRPGLQHFVPADHVSKYDLVRLVCSEFGRPDLIVREVDAAVSINRILTTQDSQLNAQLWSMAQYNDVPSVRDLVANYALWIRKNRR